MTKTGKATYASARSKYLVASQEHKTGSICTLYTEKNWFKKLVLKNLYKIGRGDLDFKS